MNRDPAARTTLSAAIVSRLPSFSTSSPSAVMVTTVARVTVVNSDSRKILHHSPTGGLADILANLVQHFHQDHFLSALRGHLKKGLRILGTGSPVKI